MGEQLHAQILQGSLSDPADQVGLPVGRHRVEDGRHEEGDHDQIERARVVLVDPVVDRHRGQRRRGQRRAGGHDQREQHGRKAPLVRSDQRGQAPQLAPSAAGLAQPAHQLGAASPLGDGHRAHSPAPVAAAGSWSRNARSGWPCSTISR